MRHLLCRNMKKTDYIKPMICVYHMESTCLLTGSKDYADPNDDPGELYDQIEFGEGYCDTPD